MDINECFHNKWVTKVKLILVYSYSYRVINNSVNCKKNIQDLKFPV